MGPKEKPIHKQVHYKTKYKLITFYKFVDIADPMEEVAKHTQFCRDIGMKGRIYISDEGISATATCNMGQYQAYKHFLDTSIYFNDITDIEEKRSDVDGHKFTRMIVKYRSEIVALGEKVQANDVHNSLQKIEIDEFKDILEKEDQSSYAIVDMRNTYEYKLGHFNGAIPAGTINFREVEKMIDTYKDVFQSKKKVIMYCTGGIRCDKLSVLLKKNGVENFYALDGGVVKYVNTHNDGKWLGNLYTFDGVISQHVGDAQTHTTIGECIYSGLKTDNIENCRYSPCNARIICRQKQFKRHGGFCSQSCYEQAKSSILIKNEKWDSMDYQQLRDTIKLLQETTTQENESKTKQIHKEVIDHVETLVVVKQFPHQTSQKEEFIDKDLLQNVLKQNKS